MHNPFILVIENKQQGTVTGILKQADFAAISVSDYKSAVDIIEKNNPALIICDEAFDCSETFEVCCKLKELPDVPPVCLLGSVGSPSYQINLQIKSGAEKYLQSPVEPLKFIRIVTKLIESRKRKETIHEKEAVFRALINNITDVITVISPDGFILYESPSVEQILGRKAIDSLGANAFDLIHPDDRRSVIEYIVKSDHAAAARGIEYRVRHQNGSWRIFHSIGRYNRSIFKTRTVLITSRDITDRKLLAERSRIAMEKARMVWWEWDPRRDKLIAGDNFSKIYGLSDLCTYKFAFKNIHPEDADKHFELFEDIRQKGGSYHTEYRFIRKSDKKTVWIEETATAILDENNEIAQIVGVAVDISERRKAEIKIRENDEKFKALFRGIPIPVYIWEATQAKDDFVLIDSNDAGDKHTTSFSSKYFGMKASDLLDDEPEIVAGIEECLTTQKTIQFEAEYHQQITGELQILDLCFVPISDCLVMVVSRDITLKKFAEEERTRLTTRIEIQNQRLNDVIASVPGAVWETALTGSFQIAKVVFISDYIEKLTGYAPETWMSESKPLTDGVHPDDTQHVIRKIAEIMSEKSIGLLEYRFIHKNGSIVWVESQVKPVMNYSGEVIGLKGISTDITERKSAEAALVKSEEQLRQSQRLESIGRLAGGIAHDFNNMLTAINGYSELLLRELKEENSIRHKVNEIKKAGERSALLTKQLLAFSRRQILKTQTLDLNDVIGDMADMLRRLIGEHIRLETRLSPQNCLISADPGQISQVLLNLAVNAHDAMPKSGSLIIQTEITSPDEELALYNPPMIFGDYVKLTVTDTGIGIDEEAQPYIFEPFFTTKEKSAGTGLGLATVYGIIKQSGGYIWLDSKPGAGASFSIYLPLTRDESIACAELPMVARTSGNETILLVEDEPTVRELTRNLLTLNGYRVITASDGIEALEIFKKSEAEIALLMTDVVMPNMGGPELAERICTIDSDVPILFCTGYSDDINMLRSMPYTKKDFIDKPFSSDLLTEKIHRLLDKKAVSKTNRE